MGPLFGGDSAGPADVPAGTQQDVVAGGGAGDGDRTRQDDPPPPGAALCDPPELSVRGSSRAGASPHSPANHRDHRGVSREAEDTDEPVDAMTDDFDGLALETGERGGPSPVFGSSAPPKEDRFRSGTARGPSTDPFGFAYGGGVSLAPGLAVAGDEICGGSRLWDPFGGHAALPLVLGPGSVELGERAAGRPGGRTHGLPARSLVEWVSSTAEQS